MVDAIRLYRSEVSCYHCGQMVGTLEGPAGGAYERFYPTGQTQAMAPSLRLRCQRCGGPTLTEQPDTVLIYPRVSFGRQRPGRKPRAERFS
jgi:hypothetical protein